MTACPPRSLVLRFSRGELKGAKLEAMARHLDECPTCMQAAWGRVPAADEEQTVIRSGVTGPVPAPTARPSAPRVTAPTIAPPPAIGIPAAPVTPTAPRLAGTRSAPAAARAAPARAVHAAASRPARARSVPTTAGAGPGSAAPAIRPSRPTPAVTPPTVAPPAAVVAAPSPAPAPSAMDEVATSVRALTEEDADAATVHHQFQPVGTEKLRAGTLLGRYVVLEPLGSGGIGDVYTAYDPQLDRKVAIKLLKPNVSRSEGSDGVSPKVRLMREAQAMAKLQHPNVVAIYDVGTLDQDVFIAMERVEGVTLSQWLRTEDRPWKEIRDVFVRAGRGLQAAHGVGIVHRDFKPQNVLISDDGRVKVLDFGLARALDAPEIESGASSPGGIPQEVEDEEFMLSPASGLLQESLTSPGTLLGTPPYMAPEQFGAEVSVNESADQFSFCVTLYEAVFRQRPFTAPNIMGLIATIKRGAVSPIPSGTGVPAWLHKVILRGLSVDPSQRFASMDRLLYALDRDRRSRRRQWTALGLVAVLSAVLAAGAAYALRPQPTDQDRDLVEQLAIDARAAAAKSYYVYPPVEQPDFPTAYLKVLELENQTGPVASEAGETAKGLRREFADTLTRLGDQYWAQDGGAPFAADYYAAALVFDPTSDRARERTTLTPGELAALRQRADKSEFSEAELVAAESLAVLAEPDDAQRVEKVKKLYSRRRAPAPSTSARLEGLLGAAEQAAIEEASAGARRGAGVRPPDPRPEPAAPPPAPQPQPPADPEPERAAVPAAKPAPSATRPRPAPVGTASKRDPAAAQQLAEEAMRAFKRGDLGGAEKLFHRALSSDRFNVTALGGLSELHFENGAYQKAVNFAKRAVRAAPRVGRYRILLGDAYFKVLKYESAREQYNKAKDVGHPAASGRLRRLKNTLGE